MCQKVRIWGLELKSNSDFALYIDIRNTEHFSPQKKTHYIRTFRPESSMLRIRKIRYRRQPKYWMFNQLGRLISFLRIYFQDHHHCPNKDLLKKGMRHRNHYWVKRQWNISQIGWTIFELGHTAKILPKDFFSIHYLNALIPLQLMYSIWTLFLFEMNY